jgi:hypothetical protein
VSLETCAHSMTTALRWHIALGGTHLSRVDFYLEDEEKLRVFRGVVDEALRGEGEAIGGGDIGLPAEDGEAQPEAATMLEASLGRLGPSSA